MRLVQRCFTSAAATSATNVEQVSLAEARGVIVSRQGFATRNRVATADEVLATIGRLGCVQLDSVMTVARAHRLTLAARVGRVPATTLNGLRRSGSVAEVWAHEASLIDANDLPHFRGGMLREQQHRWWGPVLQEHPRIAKEVLHRIEVEGPLTPGDFGGAGTPGWWEWSPAKQVFEALFSSGQLAVRERRSFARVYDLPERLYTAQQLAPVDEKDALRWRVLRAVTARGIVTEKRLSDYFRVTGRSKPLAAPMVDLIDEGVIVRVQVGEHAALADPAALTPPDDPTAAVLLCPFDNLIWDRDETRDLRAEAKAPVRLLRAAPTRWLSSRRPRRCQSRSQGRRVADPRNALEWSPGATSARPCRHPASLDAWSAFRHIRVTITYSSR